MKNTKGFTLIELLLVIALIAILASIVFVALDPLKRLKDSRDSTRAEQLANLIQAIKLNQIDNKGYFLTSINNISAASSSEVYMIAGNSNATGCNQTCATPVTGATRCIDLSGLVTGGYLGKIPVSPNGTGTWTASTTGYTLQKSATGLITLRACEAENSNEIVITQ